MTTFTIKDVDPALLKATMKLASNVKSFILQEIPLEVYALALKGLQEYSKEPHDLSNPDRIPWKDMPAEMQQELSDLYDDDIDYVSRLGIWSPIYRSAHGVKRRFGPTHYEQDVYRKRPSQ